MDVFNIVASVVLVAATLVVIWYARETVGESRKATDAARKAAEASRETVEAVGALLAVARETAASSAAAAEAARATVETARELAEVAQATVTLARAAHEAEELDRRRRQLLKIGEVAEEMFWKVAAAEGYPGMTGQRYLEQNYLAHLLAGAGIDLPACRRLAGGGGVRTALMGMARDARDEVGTALGQLTSAGEASGVHPR